MKQIKFTSMLLLATMFLGFTTCSDDDDDKNENSIIGTWKVTAWESDERGAEKTIGFQFTFKKDGFVDLNGEKDVAKWSILKKGTTYVDDMEVSTILRYDALLLTFVTAEDNGDEIVFLIKEYNANSLQVSILGFELENDPEIYSRGTLTKIK